MPRILKNPIVERAFRALTELEAFRKYLSELTPAESQELLEELKKVAEPDAFFARLD